MAGTGTPTGRARPTRRDRLQRRLRRQRRTATRDSLLGAVLCAVVVLSAGSLGWGLPGTAEAEEVVVPAEDVAVFTAAMVGDLMFGRHVEEVAARRGYEALLRPARPYLEANYVSGNLEQVVSPRDDLPEARKLIHLRSGPEPLEVLRDAGFTTLTLANNHTMDYGIPGLADTIEALDAVGIEHVGAGTDIGAASEILYQDFGDLTVATLSFTDTYVEGFVARAFQGGVLDAETRTFVPLIQQARAQADLVIAQFHWGEEYDFAPDRRQRDIAIEAAAAGADLVVGHHPHVLMPVETIGSTVVFYSLGNFVFDQGWSRTRETAVARYHLAADGTATIEVHPLLVREATPQPLSGLGAAYRRGRIYAQIAGNTLDWRRRGDSFVTKVDHRHVLRGLDER